MEGTRNWRRGEEILVMGRAGVCIVCVCLCACGRDGGGVRTSRYGCSDVSLAFTFGKTRVRVLEGESLGGRRAVVRLKIPPVVPGAGRRHREERNQ